MDLGEYFSSGVFVDPFWCQGYTVIFFGTVYRLTNDTPLYIDLLNFELNIIHSHRIILMVLVIQELKYLVLFQVTLHRIFFPDIEVTIIPILDPRIELININFLVITIHTTEFLKDQICINVGPVKTIPSVLVT